MIQEVKPPLDEALLIHFGVPGMKWGVRKEIKREGKRRAKDFMANVVAKAEYGHRPISKEEYDSLSSKPVKLGVAGSTFNRIAATNTKDLREFAYVSKDAKDHNRYKALLVPGGGLEGSKRFDVSIKVTKDIISPSKKERIDTFIETLDMNIKVKSLVGKEQTINGRKYLESFGDKSMDHLKALNNREYGLAMYQRFSQAQVMNLPIHQAYTSKLKARGYNAIVDDADKGIMSDLPIILFPKESGAHVVSARQVDKHELWDARSKLDAISS